MNEAKSAITARRPMIVSATRFSGLRKIRESATLDPRVEPVVRDVDREVGQGIDERREERHAEDRREIKAHRRSGRVSAESRPAEDGLGQDRAREQAAE